MIQADDLVMETCLLAGEIMLKNGGETYRVEDTMTHMARAAGMADIHSFVTPTTIILSYRGEERVQTRMIRVVERTIDLNKVTLVNEVSRHYVRGKLSLEHAFARLQEIDRKKPQYPDALMHAAAGLASGSFAVLLGGGVWDAVPAVLGGMMVNLSGYYFQRVLQVKFFVEFLAALLGGLLVLLFYKLVPTLRIDYMLIGTMLPLFPGLAVTSSLRDLMAGDLVAGISRGVEAIITAISVAMAAAIVLSFLE